MKAKLEFDLPEEREEFMDAVKGSRYKLMIEEIHNRVFRPHWKHGYQNQDLQKLIEDNYEVADKIIESLSEIYREIVWEEE